jgi:hypothetical protein
MEDTNPLIPSGSAFSMEQLAQLQLMMRESLGSALKESLGAQSQKPVKSVGDDEIRASRKQKRHYTEDSEEETDSEDEELLLKKPRVDSKEVDEIFESKASLDALSIQLLEKSSQSANITNLVKQFGPGQALANVDSPLLTAFQRDDELEFSAGSGAVYSIPIDNKFQDVNQIFLDSLKPWLLLMQNSGIEGISVLELQRAFALAAAMVYKASYSMNKLRTQLILKQGFPTICENAKVDGLAKKLTQNVEFDKESVSLLSGGKFAKKITNLQKVLVATKNFSEATARISQNSTSASTSRFNQAASSGRQPFNRNQRPGGGGRGRNMFVTGNPSQNPAGVESDYE